MKKACLEMIVVLETSNARPQRIAVFLYGHGSASTISQGTYFCHVPGHICLLSPPPEECLPVGECLFVIAGQCLPSVFTFLGQTFLALSIMSWHKRDWSVVSLIESSVSSGPVDHPQTAKSLRVKCTFWISFTVREWRKNELSTYKNYHKGYLQNSHIALSLEKENVILL